MYIPFRVVVCATCLPLGYDYFARSLKQAKKGRAVPPHMRLMRDDSSVSGFSASFPRIGDDEYVSGCTWAPLPICVCCMLGAIKDNARALQSELPLLLSGWLWYCKPPPSVRPSLPG